jgi:CRP-like cAMP-binding protein
VQTVLAAGEVIGELAVLTAAPRSRSMRARTETRLLSMEAASFRALIAEHPPLAQRLLRVLAERLATDTA